MHMVKKWCGSPCDRRIDRRKVLLAAAAALFLSATSVQAGITDFIMDPTVSKLSYSGSKVDLSYPAAKAPHGTVVVPYTASTDFSGRGANGLISYYSGHLYADVEPAFIQPQFTGAGYQPGLGSATGGVGPNRDGGYIPYDDGYGNPSGSFANPAFGGAPADWGEYGVTVSAVGAFARVWGHSIGPNATPSGSNAPMPLIGLNTYAVAPQIWGYLSGYQDLVSGLGNDHTSLATAASGAPFPIPLGGTLDTTSGVPVFTPNATTATYDGVTLTINVSGTVVYTLDDNNTPTTADDIWDYRSVSGQLVYHLAPEPSSMLLAGCGVVGLLAAIRRSRKRQPIVA